MEKINNFNIKNFGPINEANIDIGKINIIGGHNATGKSTASKLLYCYLKSNCSKRQDFAYESLKSRIFQALNRLNHDIRYSRKLRNLDINDLLEEYEHSKDQFYNSNEQELDKFFDKEIEDIDNFIEIIQENNESLFGSILTNLLKIEFSAKGMDSMDNKSEITVSINSASSRFI